MIENITFKTKEELLENIKIVVDNHDKVKQEIFLLHEMMISLEKDYLLLMEELKNKSDG